MPLTKAFFDSARTPHTFAGGKVVQLFSSFTQQQVDALNAVTACFDAFTGAPRCVDDLAYIMATCYAECGKSLDLTIEEYGKGAGKAYGVVTGPYNKKYYGRGPPQVTWLKNYTTAKLRTGIDFVQFPEYMCEPAKGIVYMIDAMYGGVFTGKGLRTYITPGKVTTFAAFGECRRIINGTDRKDEIAYYAMTFLLALQAGYFVSTPTQPSPQQTQPLSLGARIRALFGRK
jgi:hypothetical protein